MPRAEGKLASSTAVPPSVKVSDRQKGSSPQQSRKRRGSGMRRRRRRRGINGKWGPYKNEKSVSRSRRCQLESADSNGWREDVPRILF